jgi:hypothetical protein
MLWKFITDTASIAVSYPCPASVGLCIDASGNIYTASLVTIKMMAPNGTVTNLAGTGTQGWTDGPAAISQFTQASSLTMDASGNLYIADIYNLRVYNNGNVSTLAGQNIRLYQDGTGNNAGFAFLTSIVWDPVSGNFYAADGGANVVRRITPAGVVTTIAGNPVLAGSQNGTGAAATFLGPTAITVDNQGVLYVSEGNYGSSAIRKIVVH